MLEDTMKAMESFENFANYVLAHWKEAPSHTRAGVLYRDARTEIQELEADIEARSESNVTLVRGEQILLDKIEQLQAANERYCEALKPVADVWETWLVERENSNCSFRTFWAYCGQSKLLTAYENKFREAYEILHPR